MSITKSPIELACEIVGSQAALARILGVTPAMVNQLFNGSRPTPIEHCAAIEAATAKVVSRRDLRPDDWQKIWPEMVGMEGALADAKSPPAIESEAPEAEDARRS